MKITIEKTYNGYVIELTGENEKKKNNYKLGLI